MSINKEELSIELWNSWVTHPMTKVMMDVIAQQKDNFERKLYEQVGDSTIEDKFVRNTVFGMKCFKTMQITLSSYELFKNEINKEKK